MMATEDKVTTPGPAGKNVIYCADCRTAWCEVGGGEFWWLRGDRGASWCRVCVAFWEPHARPPHDEAIQKLCGFDLVGALNRLQAWLHAFHPEPGDSEDAHKRALAARTAYGRLYSALRSAAPERLADRAYISAIKELRRSLERFIHIATERETGARRLTAIASERRSRLALLQLPAEPEPRPLRVSRVALGLAHSLARVARWLLGNWQPTLTNSKEDPRGLELPLLQRGNQSMTLLFDIESELHLAGWTFREIGDLDLDGAKETDEREARLKAKDKHHLQARLSEIREQAEDRVRVRVRDLRKGRPLESPSAEDKAALRAAMTAAKAGIKPGAKS